MSTAHPKLYKAEYECLNCGWRFELSGLDYPEGDVDCPECNASVWPIASTIRVDSVQVESRRQYEEQRREIEAALPLCLPISA